MKVKVDACADVICKALIKASNGRWDSLVEQSLHRLGYRDLLNPSLVAQVIMQPGLQRHHALALGFFNWAEQQPGYSHNSTSYEALIQSLRNAKQFRAIDKVLKQMKLQRIALSSSAFVTIVSANIQAKRSKDAYKTFMDMKALGHRLNADVYNSLLYSLSSDGYIDLAQAVYSEMRSDRIPVNAVSFGIFIGVFCRSGDLKIVLDMINEAKQNTSFPGSIIATLVINGLCQASRIEQACWALEELRARSCKPDFIAYCIVTEALRMADRLDEVHRILKQKRKLSVAPYLSEYRDYIFALISARRIKEAYKMAQLIISSGFPLENDVYNVLIGSLSSVDPEAALALYQAMLAANQSPTSLTLLNLVQGLCNIGKADEIWEVFQDFSLKGFVTDIPTYNFIIFSLCKREKVKEAYKILDVMRKNKLSPDVESYNTIMDACCKADLLRPARRLWDEMFREGCHPIVKTYNILILKFLKIGEVEEAETLFKSMLQKGVPPDALTYRSLIDGLTKANKLDEAYKVNNDFMKSGLAPRAAIPNNVRDALSRGVTEVKSQTMVEASVR
jgi:pentatricopeptide repeat protein